MKMLDKEGFDMSHGPSTEWKKDTSSAYKSRLGVWMFLVYAVVYATFITMNVAAPALMRADVGSLNVAILFGFGLIILAVILAFIYNFFCSRAERKAGQGEA
jgi:uncharacterized membrane protein (DUF485 family)